MVLVAYDDKSTTPFSQLYSGISWVGFLVRMYVV